MEYITGTVYRLVAIDLFSVIRYAYGMANK